MASAFSFLPAKSVISYEEGVKKGHDKLPLKLQKKINAGKKITAGEELKKRGLEEIAEDAKLPKEERQKWLFEFEEEYELEEELEELEEEILIEEPPPKKKSKKTKKDDNDLKEDVAKKTKGKKKGKRKRETDEYNDDKVLAKSSTKSKKKMIAQNSDQKSKHLDDKIDEEVELEEKFLQEEDVPSEDDKNDDDFSVASDGFGDDDDDDDDELYEEKPKTKRLVKKGKQPKPKKVKEPKAKVIAQPKKKSVQKLSMKLEQEKFENCEKVFLPILRKLQKKGLKPESIEKHLNELLQKLDVLTPAFILEYQIGLLVKDVRGQYKGNDVLNKLCKSITSKMKALYAEKLKSQPANFKPKRSAENEKVR